MGILHKENVGMLPTLRNYEKEEAERFLELEGLNDTKTEPMQI